MAREFVSAEREGFLVRRETVLLRALAEVEKD